MRALCASVRINPQKRCSSSNCTDPTADSAQRGDSRAPVNFQRSNEMAENSVPSALKHGAYSELVLLPGEDPAAFAALTQSLFDEYKPAGPSETSTVTSIAKTLWQLQRLGLYEHVQYLKARGNPSSFANGKNPLSEALDQFRAKVGLIDPNESPPEVPTAPEPPKEKSNDELLLELGNFVTLDRLDKELEVETKLSAKLDRLLKRYFHIRAMKPLIGLGDAAAPALASATPVLELTITDAPTASEVTDNDAATSDAVKSGVV
jgi:hypothetical protein